MILGIPSDICKIIDNQEKQLDCFLLKLAENNKLYEINPLMMSFALDNFIAHADNIYGYKV